MTATGRRAVRQLMALCPLRPRPRLFLALM